MQNHKSVTSKKGKPNKMGRKVGINANNKCTDVSFLFVSDSKP